VSSVAEDGRKTTNNVFSNRGVSGLLHSATNRLRQIKDSDNPELGVITYNYIVQ